MKLEVGKTYKNGLGDKVKILKLSNSRFFGFLGDNEHTYTDSGKWSTSTECVAEDLISEVKGRGGARKGAGRKPKAVKADSTHAENATDIRPKYLEALREHFNPLTWTTVAKQLADKYPDAALWVLSEKVE